MAAWQLSDRSLQFEPGSPVGAGIVNVTSDSMFAGARSGTPEQAIEDGVALARAGFELIDVGAVAARHGPPVPEEVEAAALLPAIEGLAARIEAPITADTFNPALVRRACRSGAVAINDIGGGRDEMLEAVAERGCGYVLMHIEGPPRERRAVPAYEDVVDRMLEFFVERIDRAIELGVDREAIAVDPGLDFDLDTDHALEVLRRIGELHRLGRPIFVSLSRKDFIGAVLAGSWDARRPASERGPGTMAAAALAAAAGVQVHRLHDPQALDAVRMAAAIVAHRRERSGG